MKNIITPPGSRRVETVLDNCTPIFYYLKSGKPEAQRFLRVGAAKQMSRVYE